MGALYRFLPNRGKAMGMKVAGLLRSVAEQSIMAWEAKTM